MVIIWQQGDTFWIEYLNLSASLPDAAGQVAGTLQSLTRAGIFLGGAVVGSSMADNDNTQGISQVELRGTGSLTLGVVADQVRVRVNKILGTAGATSVFYHCLIFLKRPTSR